MREKKKPMACDCKKSAGAGAPRINRTGVIVHCRRHHIDPMFLVVVLRGTLGLFRYRPSAGTREVQAGQQLGDLEQAT